MGKHFVRTLSTAVLIVGSLVVVAPQPASALRYFVHGNAHCTISSGVAGYSPTLRLDVQQTVRAKIKGSFTCDKGETGIPGLTITGGTFKAISDYFGGDCSNITPPNITMQIRWLSNTGAKVRNTDVSWATPVSDATEPYQYHFAGGTVETLGVAGSYFGATAAVNFLSNTNGSLACGGGKLRGGFALSGGDFTFESPATVLAVNPASAVVGAQNVDLDVTGMDFVPGDTLSFSGGGITVNSSNVVSESEMQANVSIAANALASSRDVTVTNSTLGSSTCTSCFMVAPIVSSVTPNGIGQGAQNRDVTITGDGFAPGAITQFGDPLTSPITTNFTQFIDANTLHANISVTGLAAVGAYDVTVQDPGFGVGTCTGCFNVNAGPTVTSTNPGSRGAGSANQVVAVNGTGFDNGSTVSFGGSGISIDNTSYVSPTQLLVTIDIAQGTPNGPRSVTVANADGGQGSCAACFTVNKGPTLVNWDIDQVGGRHAVVFNSGHGSMRDTYTANVVITGANLQPGVTLSYANTWLTVNTTTYVSTTKIKQNVTIDVLDDANALPGERAVTAVNPDGGTFTLQGAVVLVG
jgi:hypothetical protein